MLYIIKRTSDWYYLDSFEDTGKQITFTFTPLIADALKMPESIAKSHMNIIKGIENDEYEVISEK